MKSQWKQWFPEEECVERNKNVKIPGMLCADIGVLLVSVVEELVDNAELKCWRKRNEKERLRLLLLTTVS